MKTTIELNGQRWHIEKQHALGMSLWFYYADDVDTAPDSEDDRYGVANSYEEAIARVEEICSQ